MESLGKGLLLIGLIFVVLGALLVLSARLGFARLPGDIVWRKGNFIFYAPIGLMILLSLLLTLALNLFGRR
jgi:hypothetical protein